LSAHSGLPALAVPAGFSNDGVPLGMEFLGSAFSESQLLSLGYGVEQTLNIRRPPFSTPALVNGKAPAPRTATAAFTPSSAPVASAALNASVTFAYEETTGRLNYTVTATGAGRDQLSAIWIHTGGDKPAAARHVLYSTGQPMTGSVMLSFADRRDLADGRLVVRFFVRGQAGSAGDTTIRLNRS
jgi:hypothetical protein